MRCSIQQEYATDCWLAVFWPWHELHLRGYFARGDQSQGASDQEVALAKQWEEWQRQVWHLSVTGLLPSSKLFLKKKQGWRLGLRCLAD